MVTRATGEERYNLDPGFERAVTTLACTRPSFYGRVGHAVTYDRLTDPACRLAFQAAHAIAQDGGGQGPASSIIVMQRLRRWVNDGKVTLEQVQAVADMMDGAEDSGLPTEDAAVAELTPVLRHQIETEVVRATVEEFSTKRGNWRRVTEMVAMADAIGKVDQSPGVAFGGGAFDVIKRLRYLTKLPTGILELDAALDGGAYRGTLSVAVGGPGAGKSMLLGHVTANSLHLGQHVAVATLELPEPVWLARLAANVTGIPTNKILNGSLEVARAKLEEVAPHLGRCTVKYFTPGATTVQDVQKWVGDIEQRAGQPVTVVVVDYGDKLRPTGKSSEREPEYAAMNRVYEGFRIWVEQAQKWGWTASQAQRNTKRKKVVSLDDVADSMGKVRVADLVITLNVPEDQSEVVFLVGKNRLGPAGSRVGPLPTEFAMGRMVPVSREPVVAVGEQVTTDVPF